MPVLSLKIGILYDRPEDYPDTSGPHDRFAEFEPESTIRAMEEAVCELGHKPIRLGAPFNLLTESTGCDLVWNIAEGYGTRNREAWAPVLCELRDLPFLGSDAYTLSLSLDKAATKQLVQNIDVPTPKWTVYKPGKSFEPWDGPFPVFVKPRYEGTAKGISEQSVILDNENLRKHVIDLSEKYQQDILIEVFLSGDEYTCAVAGTPLHAKPVLQRALHNRTKIGFHAVKSSRENDYTISHHLPQSLEHQLHNWSLKICDALDIRDFARLDFKTDECGNPYFLEINPLPTFAIDNTFAILAEMEGIPYPAYLSKILKEAIGRVINRY